MHMQCIHIYEVVGVFRRRCTIHITSSELTDHFFLLSVHSYNSTIAVNRTTIGACISIRSCIHSFNFLVNIDFILSFSLIASNKSFKEFVPNVETSTAFFRENIHDVYHTVPCTAQTFGEITIQSVPPRIRLSQFVFNQLYVDLIHKLCTAPIESAKRISLQLLLPVNSV